MRGKNIHFTHFLRSRLTKITENDEYCDMNLSQYLLFGALLLSTAFADDLPQPEEDKVNKLHIAYLMQCKEYISSVDLYHKYQAELGRHDFETLQSLATIILEQGARSDDAEKQLLSIYGTAIAGCSSSYDTLEAGILSPNPETQIASIQLLGRLQDDRSDELLIKAMSSEFFYTRIEAAYQLAMRKHRKATGQIEALMYRVPHQVRFFFPEFFALIGTSDAISVLRQLMDDTEVFTRIEAILSAARHGRDDLLPAIRAYATHLNVAQQEACAAALGLLKDSRSIPQLKKLSRSPSSNVQLAAYKSLYQLGDASAARQIEEMAKSQNIFAIATLGEVPGSEDTLADLVKKEDLQVRLNAAISLLKRRDNRCLTALYEILMRDMRDLGYQPQGSLGRSMMAWKIISSSKQHQKKDPGTPDFQALSVSFREQVLQECIELKEKDFLAIARRIFISRQTELVPQLVLLLQNHRSPESLQLLQEMAQKSGAPLVRAYCNLACFRLALPGPYEESLKQWIDQKKEDDMIRFRPMLPYSSLRLSDFSFELTPEESSRLLIDSYQALADRHDEASINALLQVIKDGNAKNRYALAGLLIRAIQ